MSNLYMDRGDTDRGPSTGTGDSGVPAEPALSDRSVADAIAELEFRALEPSTGGTWSFASARDRQRKPSSARGDLYGVLLKGYHRLMQAHSPVGLSRVLSGYEINAEFASFSGRRPRPPT